MKKYLILALICFITQNLFSQDIDLSKEIRKSVKIPAPRNLVWKRFTTKEELAKLIMGDADIELKIGGKWEIYFQPEADSGSRGSETCKVLSFIPNEMISFSWNAPPNQPVVRKEKTWVVMYFREISPNETQVELVHLGWKHSPEWDFTYAYFNKAWEKILTLLKSSFMDKNR